MITFDRTSEIFYLHTCNTTYAIGILEKKVLLHLYWGKKLVNALNTNVKVMRNRDLFAIDCGNFSTGVLPLEYPTFGSADTRLPAFNAVYSDGSRITKLEYFDYDIVKSKPILNGLPSTYCEKDDNVETLVIRLKDCVKNVTVELYYTVYEELDAITRSAKIFNNGERFELNTALSTTVDFFGLDDSDIIHLDGAWCRERHITRREIAYGNQNIESRSGASSHSHNPFIAICDRNTTENHGNVYGLSLVYSGNFTAGVELNDFKCGRAYIGINPFNFNYVLENGDEFQTPEAVLVYSSEGIGKMSRIYHKLYRTRLCRGKFRDTERFTLLNNWEATYFNFDEEKIVDIAKKASEIGVDTMVLDDGWFSTRNGDNSGLGDWYENPQKLPNGLKHLVDRVNALGLRFGLWFEPEMVNPQSELFRKHPDWILHTKNRESSLSRNQLVLDLSRGDVCKYIIDSVSAILKKANIEYVKWDMNRYMSEVGSLSLPADRQGEVMHRYILGLYSILEELTSNFPNVLFESCASGGGRFDPGMLYYMPQTWTSDDSDAIERLKIQYGTSLVYPYSSMGAHVSACPNHQVGRTTPFSMRCNVAMPGQFGFELDLNTCTEEELEIAKQSIIEHKKLQSIFHKGDCYRLKSPFDTNISALEFISEDKQTVVLCIYSKIAIPNAPDEFIRLEGLEESTLYMLDGQIYGGDYLMNKGIRFDNGRDNRTFRYILKRCQ